MIKTIYPHSDALHDTTSGCVQLWAEFRSGGICFLNILMTMEGKAMSAVVRTRLVKIGNSHDIRIPKVMLDQLHMTGLIELEVQSA